MDNARDAVQCSTVQLFLTGISVLEGIGPHHILSCIIVSCSSLIPLAFNAEIIKQGYGFAYTRFPFKYMDDFRRHQREAREQGRGLWGRVNR